MRGSVIYFSLSGYSHLRTLAALAGTRVWAGGFFSLNASDRAAFEETFDTRTEIGGAEARAITTPQTPVPAYPTLDSAVHYEQPPHVQGPAPN